MIAALILTLLSVPGELDGLGGPQTTPFVAPGQLFQIGIPYGWTPYSVDKDPNAIQFRNSLRGDDATLIIRKFVVPSEARPRQLVLNAIDQKLSKLPRFRVMQKRDVSLAGQPAASVIGTYAFQGNIQYPRLIENIFVVIGTEAYSLYFECFEPAAHNYANELNMMYSSFTPRVASPGVNAPFSVPDEGNSPGEQFKIPDPRDIPF
jgi:hypothetical protein